MLFPTVVFAVFFVVVFVLNWLTMPHRRAWRILMLLASWFFYGWWDWRFVPLLVVSGLANQAAATVISRAPVPRVRRLVLGSAVAANLGVLAVFKYYGFFASSVVNALRRLGIDAGLPVVQFVLPVGISFFTFHAVSYVVDVYRGETKPVHVLDFLLYMAFFPHLVAGPIVRVHELVPQFIGARDPRDIDAGRGFQLIVVGLLKKVVIADLLARSIVDPVFASPGEYSALEAAAAIYGFSVQIYCDFSGYTDIAIGVALLLGFRLPDNFDAPYAAVSAQDFWRRWHMTLSRWLRDYLYVPLGGSRSGRTATYRNLLLTMLLGGLWHGAAGRFLLWGGLHGLWLAAGRHREQAPSDSPCVLLRRRLVTFHAVTLLWVLFRADSIPRAASVVSRLAAWGPAPAVTPALVLAIGMGIALQYASPEAVANAEARFSRLRPLAQGVVLALALVAIDVLGPEGVSAFIYFNF